VRARRRKLGLHPVYKRVDTCAAEFSTSTAYLYSTYEDECEANPTSRRKIMILGGGPNRIGQGIEFDYCCVHASMALREDGFETIMVNCNPETVSTDYDTSDRLYFEPLTFEDVMEIIEKEKPEGVIVQYGGQTPLKLSRALRRRRCSHHRYHRPTASMSPRIANGSRSWSRASSSNSPPTRWRAPRTRRCSWPARWGFPLVVRPSYVLGGRGMEVVFNEDDLREYMVEAVKVSNDSPVLAGSIPGPRHRSGCGCRQRRPGRVDRRDHGVTSNRPGVHSGDSGCSLPPNGLSPEVQDALRVQTRELAKALNVIGLMNVQFAIQSGVIYILEVNPRASRTVPFVSKATGVPLAKVAARVMTGKTLASQGQTIERIPPYFSVKEAVFPFVKFPEADPILGPEMKSTGEVMGTGHTFGEAYAKAQAASA